MKLQRITQKILEQLPDLKGITMKGGQFPNLDNSLQFPDSGTQIGKNIVNHVAQSKRFLRHALRIDSGIH